MRVSFYIPLARIQAFLWQGFGIPSENRKVKREKRLLANSHP